ncbi:DNA repair endonuclease XPF [Aplysia californica]|uniref:DNA repair endonuclease XPF n=1 Tax=Aplysia californica TaxID=6500 RepID=A0ABM0JKJ1_APLCA|nr:DNA repair endonuclease XPF [Aplysia californica]XP_005095874.1 DNA repair endonuclease XPF [Aplysia californica]
MLDYENQIFLDAFHDDGLLVMSRGLGLSRLFTEFLKVYSDPASLVLVLNTTPADENFFTEQLEKHGISKVPRIITNEINATDRQTTYMEGGVLFITSRILVVDLLTDRVPVSHVTGIMVYRAHKIIESCQEAFILRLYREKNKTGFIKAFTDNAEAFTRGFCQVERMMKNLFVKKLFLWPRFQASVVTCFNKHKVDVVEVHQHLTPAMTACQTSLLDIINACIAELKRSNPSIDMDEITVENALSKSFDLLIRLQLEPLWHQLSVRTRQLVSDLKTIRLILRQLTQYDCVTFHSFLQSIRSNEKSFAHNTGWLFLDAADSLFVHARERVYGSVKFREKEKGKKQKKMEDKNEEQRGEESDDEDVTTSLEPCPKWQALSEILAEIAEDEDSMCEVGVDNDGVLDTGYRVLVCAEDDRTCSQLKEYLSEGAEVLMNRMFQKYLMLRKGRAAAAKGDFKSKENKKKAAVADEDALTLTQMMRAGKGDDSAEGDDKAKEFLMTSKDAYCGIVTSPMTIIHPLHGCSDPHGLARTLEEVEPKYVVLYDADMSLVRQLEVYKASRPGKPLRVYFMMYKGSVEEQRYLTTLRKEKEAFEYLIREKATMVISEEQDGRSEDDPNLARGAGQQQAGPSSRKGGVDIVQKNQVIVDMREFRSELPSLIHRRGIEIEPITLEVGDYILTPDICVERKSVSDLIGSLNNGRLYQQALSMSRFYKRPMLLIEFDANKPFSLQAKSSLGSDVSLQDVTSKLAMLTMHFPKLRLLWCPSPYASAELFEELKAGRPQPNAEIAMTVTASSSEVPEWNDKYNHGPQDFVLRMPGINSKNFFNILNKFRDLHEVSEASLEELTQALGSATHAQQLYDFLHKEHSVEDATVKDASKEKKKFKGRGGKGFASRGRGKAFVGQGRGVKRKN